MAGAVPAGRNHPHPNYTADPIYRCCCTARTWNIISICFKMVYLAVYFALAFLIYFGPPESEQGQLVRSGKSMNFLRARESESSEQNTANKVLFVVFWSVFLFLLILYSLALYGIIKEKLGLITFYIIWLCLESLVFAGLSLFFVASGKSARRVGSLGFGSVFWGIFMVLSAIDFRKRVALRQSRHLQSEPSTFYSA